jgi:hypothetical protein
MGSTVSTSQSPSVLTANDTATLSWVTPATPAGASFSYTVSRGTGQGLIGGNCGGTLTATTCTDGSLAANQTYNWTVTAVVTVSGAPSNWVSNTPLALSVKVAGPLTQFAVDLSPNAVTAGGTVTATVSPEDTNGNIETAYAGIVHFTSSDGLVSAGSGLPADYTFTSGTTAGSDNGAHVFTSGVTFKTAGSSQTVTVNDTGSPSDKGTSNGVNVSAAAASTLAVSSGSAQSANVSTAFTGPLVAIVKDQYGNPVSGVSVIFAAPTSAASGTFASAGCTTNTPTTICGVSTDASGLATSSTFTANATSGGPYNVSAASAGLTPSSVNFALTNSAVVSFTANSVATSLDSDVTEIINSGDTITVTYSEAPEPSSVCTSWTGTSKAVTLDINGLNSADTTITIASASSCPGWGTLDLGGKWTTTTLTTAAATVAESGDTLTITLTANPSSTVTQKPGALTLTYTPGSITDSGGNAVSGTPTESVANGVDAF